MKHFRICRFTVILKTERIQQKEKLVFVVCKKQKKTMLNPNSNSLTIVLMILFISVLM